MSKYKDRVTLLENLNTELDKEEEMDGAILKEQLRKQTIEMLGLRDEIRTTRNVTVIKINPVRRFFRYLKRFFIKILLAR